jgi:hypothetical protein
MSEAFAVGYAYSLEYLLFLKTDRAMPDAAAIDRALHRIMTADFSQWIQ